MKNSKTGKLSKRDKLSLGFTMVEIMIVLAMAGLIIIAVLKGVPQLQRNSRNNARKEDVARIFTGVSKYLIDHQELTLSDGPNELLKDAGKMLSSDGEMGKLGIIYNDCSLLTGNDPAEPSEQPPLTYAVGCTNDDETSGVYMFREDHNSGHGYLGPYHYYANGLGYTVDTVHVMVGGKCDTAKSGDPTGSNYAYFSETNDPTVIAIAYALEEGKGEPKVYCNDYSF